jgi:ATP-dependent DNA helicase RecG
VFGIDNKTKKIVGTDYRDTRGLETLKHEIAQNTTGGIGFINIYEVYDSKGDRIVMFKIPAAVTSVPTAWKGHWYGRNGESLSALSTEKLDRIRGQAHLDWSKAVIEKSDIRFLDEVAIQIARASYKDKLNREHISIEIDKMSDEDFLTSLKLMVDGKLTNAAMVLLGNNQRDYIMDSPARLMWRLYGSDTMVKDYMEFGLPFITLIDRALPKIRNLDYRYMPDRTTISRTTIYQYDMDLLRELLNNCIAHMMYYTGGRIYLDEYEDMIIISNPGTFIPGDIQKVLKPGYTAPYYRNQLLTESMMKFDMIDTVQMGIRKVYNIQRSRYFPMPDYDFGTPQKVAVTVHGKILDINYTQLLFEHEELSLDLVFLLDRVQKKLPLEKEQYNSLKQLGYIDGNIPNVYVSAAIADSIGERVQYTKNKAMDDQYYRDMIVSYLQQWGGGRRSDFIELLADKLPNMLDDKQKEDKIRNMLMSMKRKGIIVRSDGSKKTGVWELAKNDST